MHLSDRRLGADPRAVTAIRQIAQERSQETRPPARSPRIKITDRGETRGAPASDFEGKIDARRKDKEKQSNE